MKKKISVIGGSGFVGTNLCSALERSQVEFEILDLKKSKKFSNKSKIADIRNIDSLRDNITGDIVINLAAVHRDDVEDLNEYIRTNIEGAANLAQICSEKGICKIIFTSSTTSVNSLISSLKLQSMYKYNPTNHSCISKHEFYDAYLRCNFSLQNASKLPQFSQNTRR